MNICFLTLTDYPEGAAMGRRVHLLARGMAEAGHEVRVLVGQRFAPGPTEAMIDGVRVKWASPWRGGHAPSVSSKLGVRLRACAEMQRIVADDCDWLIVVFPEIDGLASIGIARAAGTRIAITYEDARYLPANPTWREQTLALRGAIADRVLPRAADVVFPISGCLYAELQRVAPATRARVLPAVVDTKTFVQSEEQGRAFRERWHLGGELVVGYLGTYWEVEGLRSLLDATKAMVERKRRLKLLVCGRAHKGVRCDDVGIIANELGIGDVVVEAGWQDTAGILGAMSAADVLVVPKKADRANVAGFPTKLAEFLSMGKPVIASDVGDIGRYVRDGEEILLTRPGEVECLAHAIEEVLRTPDLARRLSTNGRAAAIREFDYRSVAARALTEMRADDLS